VKAAVYKGHGSSDVIEVIDVEMPKGGDTDVIIQVKAFALNRLDIWTRTGLPNLEITFPHVGGSDLSGIIHWVGNNVTHVKIGDRVAVNSTLSCGHCKPCLEGEISLCVDINILGEHVWGGSAEFAVVPSLNVIHLPEYVSFVDAAAISLTALTVYRMLHTRAKVRPGEIVLVTGSGGGIGTVAIQIAVHLGARVLALTSSKEKETKALELGAVKVFNYHDNPSWGKEIWKYTGKLGVDVVIDSTGQAVFQQAVRSLAKGGRYVTCGATTGSQGELNLNLLFWKQLSILGSTMASHQEFREVMALFFSGKIHPVIDSIYSFDQVVEAHNRLEDPNHQGKIVINLDL
jgi:NADPH:quinone reductase-like Zn-dependent oxidoreductase